MVSRVELVELVIADAPRAAKVRELYIRMDDLILAAKQAQARQLALLAARESAPEAEVHERVAAFEQAEWGALEDYFRLQLELRRVTTPQEFARLDAIK